MILREVAGRPSDGLAPTAGLIQIGSTLFGTTESGGDACSLSSGCGTIFSMNTDGSGFTLLHEFAGGANDGSSPSGLSPIGPILVGTPTFGNKLRWRHHLLDLDSRARWAPSRPVGPRIVGICRAKQTF
jgi:uncharacterized repeat protein (TIGR03803 family)